MFIAYPSVSSSSCISQNQNRSLHDQNTHTSVQKSNGGITRTNMKNVLSNMFSPLVSLHLYSFSHFILSHFLHCLITFIFSLLFSTLNHFSLFLSTFTFISIFLYFLISFYFPFHFHYPILSFISFFPFSFSQISPNSFYFPYISFHFSYFSYFLPYFT
jgi:hypothetical protein